MIDPQSPDILEEKAVPANNHPGNHDGLDELRRLLVGPEQQEIAHLQKRLDAQDELLPADVGRVLPEAVRLRSRQDKKVTEALLPTVEEAIGISVRKIRKLN